MDWFPLTKDVQAMLQRMEASMARIDGASAEVQLLARNANAVVTEMLEILAAFKAGAASAAATLARKAKP